MLIAFEHGSLNGKVTIVRTSSRSALSPVSRALRLITLTMYVIEIQCVSTRAPPWSAVTCRTPGRRPYSNSAAIADRLTVAAGGFSRVVVLTSPIFKGAHSGARSFPGGFHFVSLILVFFSWHFDSPFIQVPGAAVT